ncbi:hypothetical protein CEUSTIGMA_g11067.t1 [Chlamydomonas eustigma]|uniref:Uncharacterized protein n=1 Tax=Chlamydomonas eustigma TaxID=1157962 RepID=A0A250XKT8_9CHLO|nr:hypothetical protein CEUSTIGMA_g11067.t1 [Chlamydomonas eustigma]|eukprot:GAX83643.1 hypothetical protein CEUSTIGMA_g11067.t1 [Chlamydomonas eustigma]
MFKILPNRALSAGLVPRVATRRDISVSYRDDDKTKYAVKEFNEARLQQHLPDNETLASSQDIKELVAFDEQGDEESLDSGIVHVLRAWVASHKLQHQQYSSISAALEALNELYQKVNLNTPTLEQLLMSSDKELSGASKLDPAEEELSHFLQDAPSCLWKLDERLLQDILRSVSKRKGPIIFFSLVWKGIKEALRRDDCEIAECYLAGQALLHVAASQCAYELNMKAAITTEAHLLQQQILQEEPIIATCLEPDVGVILDDIQRNSTPSKRLWTLYSTVHIDVFDLVGEKIKKQALAAAAFGDASLTSEDLAESQDDKPSFPNPAQRLLLCITSYNALCSCKGLKGLRAGQEAGPADSASKDRALTSSTISTSREAYRYVVSRLRLDSLSTAALKGLINQVITSKQVHALLVSLVELSAPLRPVAAMKPWVEAQGLMISPLSSSSRSMDDWQLGPASLAALDEALLEVALPSASLGMTAQLVSLRACLGMPLAPALTRLVEEVVLLQGAGAESTARLLGLIQDSTARAEEAAKDECGEDEECTEEQMAISQSLVPDDGSRPQNNPVTRDGSLDFACFSELKSLSSLLEATSRGLKLREGTGVALDMEDDNIEGVDFEGLDQLGAPMDIDLLLNKTYMALAMANSRFWESPHFLLRLYPSLFQSCLALGASSVDLMSERYMSSLTTMFQRCTREARSHKVILNDVELLHAVATVLCQHAEDQQTEEDDEDASRVNSSAIQLRASLTIMANVDVMHSFQSHCARVLCEGLSSGFIRVKPWLRLLEVLLISGAACPQLVAVLTWALAESSFDQSPFGRSREEFLRICKLWYGLLPSKRRKQELESSDYDAHEIAVVGGVSTKGSLSRDLPHIIDETISADADYGTSVSSSSLHRLLSLASSSSVVLPGVGVVSDSTLESYLSMARTVIIDDRISVPTVLEWKMAVLTRLSAVSDDTTELLPELVVVEPCL